jgi:hypothetical protein
MIRRPLGGNQAQLIQNDPGDHKGAIANTSWRFNFSIKSMDRLHANTHAISSWNRGIA